MKDVDILLLIDMLCFNTVLLVGNESISNKDYVVVLEVSIIDKISIKNILRQVRRLVNLFFYNLIVIFMTAIIIRHIVFISRNVDEKINFLLLINDD